MRPLLAFLAFIFSLETFAQHINGVLINNLGKGIDNATISVNRGKIHTHSDENGFFKLNGVSINDTIYVQHFLYNSDQYIITQIDSEKKLKITLKDKIFELDNVTITAGRSAYSTVSNIDVLKNPVSNGQELMRLIPGLIIGQHAGGGKAEQMFLRGFDLDHGTDINISVDGMPVNMVSHAHGQGYADLHYVIPETIDDIDYGKGPYEISKGNMATAGYVAFKTKESLNNNYAGLEIGQFNTLRNLALINLYNQPESKTKSYIAAEYSLTDGPFEATQAFNRVNIFSKLTHNLSENEKISFTASHFDSRWDASGQIPQRAVDSGLITRFGAIDNKEGGSTSRQNIAFNHQKYLSGHSILKSSIYYSKYDFELFSNFTFFLRDSINGDQIKQKENRTIYGANMDYTHDQSFSAFDLSTKITAGLRHDKIQDNELSYTKNRSELLDQINLGNVAETNAFATLSSTLDYGKWSVNGGIRLDHFRFTYQNLLNQQYNLNHGNNNIIAPKLNIQYSPNNRWQAYFKVGKGFHSNDTRVALAGEVNNSLPAAYGMDLGLIFKPLKNLLINTALWALYSDQEFVYVGDEGVVEAGGKSQRRGIDLSMRYNPAKWIFIYSDLAIAQPKAIGESEGQNNIPLAPKLTNTGGINISFDHWNASIKYRHVADRPANEDYSIIAQGYTVIDFNTSYRLKNITLGIDINNVFNTAWNETQFATESRLQGETQAVEEIHFTPGMPFMIKGKLGYNF